MSHFTQNQRVYSLDKNIKIAFIRAEFNDVYTTMLQEKNEQFLLKQGFLNIAKFTVPGAYELPGFVKKVYDFQKPDLIICFGVVIRGDTTHYDHVAGECFRGLMDISLQTNASLINGVLTCENVDQVQERISDNYAISGLNLLEELKKI